MNRLTDLQGKVAVVTGASQGLGRAFAAHLARQGMKIVAVARSSAGLESTVSAIRNEGGEAHAAQVNVTDEKSVESCVRDFEENLGPIDLLVNAAGEILPVGNTWDLDLDKWWRVMETNVKGPLICCKSVISRMIPRRRGRIINIASSTVLHCRPYMSAYVTSKTALVKLSEVLAKELEPYGISVFAMHPGTVNTAMAQALMRPENVDFFLWFKKIFDEHRDDPPAKASDLVASLASGVADSLSGRYFLAPVDIDSTISHGEEILANNLQLLRMRFPADHEHSHDEHGV
jgi:NAD(P)-dependent dehydrogenase (short-subunit alcohol dehydrogenase family)